MKRSLPRLVVWIRQIPAAMDDADDIDPLLVDNPVADGTARGYSAVDEFFTQYLAPPDWFFDASAGLGDSLLLGFGDDLRSWLSIDGIDRSSSAYTTGEVLSFAAGGTRIAYAGAAKGFSLIGRSMGGLEGAQFASRLRNSLKVVARGGLFPNFRRYPFSQVARRYNNDPDAIISAAGRTNFQFNVLGTWSFGGAAVNEAEK